MLGNLSCADFSMLHLFTGNFLFQLFFFLSWLVLITSFSDAWDSASLSVLEPQRGPGLIHHVMSHSCCPQPAPAVLTLSVFQSQAGTSEIRQNSCVSVNV